MNKRLITRNWVLAVSIIILIAIKFLKNYTWTTFWNFLRIPTMSPYFADLRTIQASVSSANLGFNPQIYNPTDPWHRTMNYPLIWAEIAKVFNLKNELNFLIFGICIVFLFVISIGKLIQLFPDKIIVLYVMSSSTLLGVERGNIDLFIFSLVLGFLLNRNSYFNSFLFLAISTALKIYPIILFFLVKGKSISILLKGAILFVILYSLFPQFNVISQGNTASGNLAYGKDNTFKFYSNIIKLNSESKTSFLLIFILITLCFYVLFQFRDSNAFSFEDKDTQQRLIFFLAGSSIYLVTFAISNNWDYRLIFLIFCVPFFRVIRKDLGLTALTTTFLAMNSIYLPLIFGENIGEFISQTAKFTLWLIFLFIYITHRKNIKNEFFKKY